MAYGDGSITQMKGKNGKPIPNCWRVVVPLGTNGKGKRLRKTKVVHGSKTDARKVRDELLRDANQGIDVLTADRLTFTQLVDMWLPVATRDVDDEYRKELTSRALYFCRRAGSWKIKQITTQDCYALMDWLLEAKAADGREIGPGTSNVYLKCLRRIFKFAIENGFIFRNPAEGVKLLRENEVNRRSLSRDEAAILLAKLNDETAAAFESVRKSTRFKTSNKYYHASCLMAVQLVLATGLRRGEALGMTWGCVDLEAGSVRVERSLAPRKKIHEPKTQAGIRTVSIDAATVGALLIWRELQVEYCTRIGVTVSDTSPVFTSRSGDWQSIAQFGTWWDRWRCRNGFPTLKIHELRHTQATHLLANNVDIKTVQERMGHADASVTLNIYAHALPENDRKAADLIGTLFSKPTSETVVAFKSA